MYIYIQHSNLVYHCSFSIAAVATRKIPDPDPVNDSDEQPPPPSPLSPLSPTSPEKVKKVKKSGGIQLLPSKKPKVPAPINEVGEITEV